MCLKQKIELSEVLAKCPGNEFFAYKIVQKENDRLVSPHYQHKIWSPGLIQSTGQNRGNGDSGIYLFLAEPGVGILDVKETGMDNARILRLQVKKKNVLAGGHDSWGTKSGITIVVSEVNLREEDYYAALDDKVTERKLEEHQKTAKKTVKTVKKKAKKKEVKIKKTVANARKKAKKVVKKKTKQQKQSEKTAKTAQTKAKKIVKKAKEGNTKNTAKAKKTIRAAVGKPILEDMTVRELRQRAKIKLISGYSRMTRNQLIAALKA